MVKSFKNLLKNQERLEAESWYIASETQGLPSIFQMMVVSWPLTFKQRGQIYHRTPPPPHTHTHTHTQHTKIPLEKKLKSYFRKMYYRLMSETYNVLLN